VIFLDNQQSTKAEKDMNAKAQRAQGRKEDFFEKSISSAF